MQIKFHLIVKNQIVILKSKQNKSEGNLKIELCGKRFCLSEKVTDLGVKVDTNLSWQYHVNDLSIDRIEQMLPCSK